jgi:outer membrane protein TolC
MPRKGSLRVPDDLTVGPRRSLRSKTTRWSPRPASGSARRAVELAQQLHLHGLADFLSVLEAQRSLYDIEDQLAASEQTLGVRLAALFKSLGGVWPEPVDEKTR